MIITHLQNDLQDGPTDLLLYENDQSEFVLTIRRSEDDRDFIFESSSEVECLIERLRQIKTKIADKEAADF